MLRDFYIMFVFCYRQTNWNLQRGARAPNNIVIPNQCAHWCGNLHRISDYLSSSSRRGRVSRPPEFRDLYGTGRETRPLRCSYGWYAKFQFFERLRLPDMPFYRNNHRRSGGCNCKGAIFRKAPRCGGEWSKAGPALEAAGRRWTGGCGVPQEGLRRRPSLFPP